MDANVINELKSGLNAAYINGSVAANLAYNPEEGKKVISSVEDELLRCDQFQISVAFITMGGVTPLLQTLKGLEEKGIKGQILTTNYLNFSEPRALEKLNGLKNITLKMYDVHQNLEVGDMVQERVIRRDTNMSALVGKEKS